MIKITLESNPLKSTMLVGILGACMCFCVVSGRLEEDGADPVAAGRGGGAGRLIYYNDNHYHDNL